MDGYQPGVFELVPAPSPAAAGDNRRALLARVCLFVLAIQLPVAFIATAVRLGSDAPEKADRGFLVAAADRTAAVQQMRFEAHVTMKTPAIDVSDALVVTGTQAGDRRRLVMDLSAIAGGSASALRSDMTIEIVSDSAALFLRAPLFAGLGDSQVPSFAAPLVELGDSWGRVDLSAVDRSVSPKIATQLSGAAGMDLNTALDLLRSANNASKTGASEVHGVSVTTYEARISLKDLMAAEGIDAEMMEALVSSMGGGRNSERVVSAVQKAEAILEVGIDADGLVRRARFALDKRVFEKIAEELGGSARDAPEFEVSVVIELLDVGDPSITVEMPEVADPVDLTQWAIDVNS